jgi:hypothetical protein
MYRHPDCEGWTPVTVTIGSVGWTTLGMGRSAMEALVAARVTKETLERQGKKMS